MTLRQCFSRNLVFAFHCCAVCMVVMLVLGSMALGQEATADLVSSPEEPSPERVLLLCKLSQELMSSWEPRDTALQQAVWVYLAKAGTPVALGHLHEAFETHPERRAPLAVALSHVSEHSARAEDWRLLVRALYVVRGADALPVVTALKRYSERANKPEWLRRLIQVGLEMKEQGEPAFALVEHWSQQRFATEDTPLADRWRLVQEWFERLYPELLPAVLPQPGENARWQLEQLAPLVQPGRVRAADLSAGAAAYKKGQCHKCHRFDGEGEKIGPDLTGIQGRLTRRELLEALLFPSERVSDQFRSYTLALRDGRQLTGILGSAAGDKLIVLQPNGEKATVDRREVEDSAPNRQSAMPDNLLDAFNEQEIVALIEYLAQPAE